MRALISLIGFILLFTLSLDTNAGVITKVKGNQALMDFEGDSVPENGATLPIMQDGKTVGRIKITQVKGKKARGTVVKGNAPEGAQVGGGGDLGGGDDMGGGGGGNRRRGGGRRSALWDGTVWGAQFGYVMDTQSVTLGSSTVSMTGSGMALKAFWNFPISGSLRLDARTGYEQLAVKGSVAGSSFNTSISYVTGDGILRYHFGSGGFVPFGGLGACIYYPVSSSTNALDTSKIGLTTVFLVDAGFNYVLSDSFIQATFEYQMYPPSNDVKTTAMGIRLGYGWRW